MKARRGFIATSFTIIIALFLLLASAFVFEAGLSSVSEEAWFTSNMERSLYPIAWSTTNFVLQSLYDEADSGVYGSAWDLFVSGDASSQVSFHIPDIRGVVSCEITLIKIPAVDVPDVIYVYTTASSLEVNQKKTVKGVLGKDASGSWEIKWN